MTNEVLINLFAEALEVDPSTLTLETKIADVDEWNSLTWLTIISLLDERHSISLTASEIRSLQSIDDIVKNLSAKMSARAVYSGA